MIDLNRSADDVHSVVVVGDQSAKAVAEHLDEEYDVTLLSSNVEVVRATESDTLDAHRADPRSAQDLHTYAAAADAAVVGARRDRVTLLAAQLLRNTCGIESVVVQVNDPENRELFEDLGMEILESGRLLAPEVKRSLADSDGV